MALPVVRRRLRGWRPRDRVPATGLSVVLVSDDVLVGIPPTCARGRSVPQDLRAETALSRLCGSPTSCCLVSCSPAVSTWPRRSAPCLKKWSTVQAVCDRRQHAPMSFTRRRAVGCGASLTGRCASASRSRRFASSSVARRSRPSPEPARYAISAIRAAFRGSERPAGMGLDRAVALRVFGERREADRHQHRFPLPRRRQTAFHASGPIAMRRTEQ